MRLNAILILSIVGIPMAFADEADAFLHQLNAAAQALIADKLTSDDIRSATVTTEEETIDEIVTFFRSGMKRLTTYHSRAFGKSFSGAKVRRL